MDLLFQIQTIVSEQPVEDFSLRNLVQYVALKMWQLLNLHVNISIKTAVLILFKKPMATWESVLCRVFSLP